MRFNHVSTYYIATRGSREGIARARRVRDAFAIHGLVWTFDWTIDMEKRFDAGLVSDTDLTLSEKTRIARLDRDAVLRADFVVFLEENEKSLGAAGELSFALAYHKRVFVVTAPGWPHAAPHALFAALAAPSDIFATDEQMLAAVLSTYGDQ